MRKIVLKKLLLLASGLEANKNLKINNQTVKTCIVIAKKHQLWELKFK